MDYDTFMEYGKAYSEKEPEAPTSLFVPASLVAEIYQRIRNLEQEISNVGF